MLPLAAVFLTTVFGGAYPGLLSVTVTTIALLYLVYPAATFYVASPADRIWLAIYFLLALAACALGTALKTTLQVRSEISEKLEAEVASRTKELTQANEKLRTLLVDMDESRRFLDTLLDHIPLGVYVKQAETLKFLWVNKSIRELLGPEETYIGKTSSQFLQADLGEKMNRSDREALAQAKVIELEQKLPTYSLGERLLKVKKVPIYNRAGEPIYILGIVEDITETKRLEEKNLQVALEQAARTEAERKKLQLEEAVRARDTFLSICSHELKTPLTSLKLQMGIIQKIFEHGPPPTSVSPKVRELVLTTDREIDRINRLINDMLDVSRIRSGKLSLQIAEVDLSQIIHDVVATFRADPAYRDIPIIEEVPKEVCGIWDRDRMKQIIINLVSNALKYGNQKPVHIVVYSGENSVRLIVEDQGIGISQEDQRRIFQRFERAGASESISGLGLGLYIVKQIVIMHGGKIWVNSELGQGSQFNVELPYDATSVQAA
jgi:PAS domain S-box-containing protein